MKKSLTELAELYGVSDRTIRRYCQANNIQIVKGQVEHDGIVMVKSPKGLKPVNGVKPETDSFKPVAVIDEHKTEPATVVTVQTKRAIESRVKPEAKAPRERDSFKAAMTFNSRINVLLAIAVLMSTDAISFAWIAWNAFPGFPKVAATLFAGAGMAVGYSAIRNILSYRGWNSDSWLYGFALLQIGVHLCAMNVFGDYSVLAGKILISALVPVGLAGLSVSIRTELDKLEQK